MSFCFAFGLSCLKPRKGTETQTRQARQLLSAFMPKTPQGDGNFHCLIATLGKRLGQPLCHVRQLSCLKPRKGTETPIQLFVSLQVDQILSCLKPRKGTETIIVRFITDSLLHFAFMPKTPQGDGNEQALELKSSTQTNCFHA
jgi:hypothetical protein